MLYVSHLSILLASFEFPLLFQVVLNRLLVLKHLKETFTDGWVLNFRDQVVQVQLEVSLPPLLLLPLPLASKALPFALLIPDIRDEDLLVGSIMIDVNNLVGLRHSLILSCNSIWSRITDRSRRNSTNGIVCETSPVVIF